MAHSLFPFFFFLLSRFWALASLGPTFPPSGFRSFFLLSLRVRNWASPLGPTPFLRFLSTRGPAPSSSPSSFPPPSFCSCVRLLLRFNFSGVRRGGATQLMEGEVGSTSGGGAVARLGSGGGGSSPWFFSLHVNGPVAVGGVLRVHAGVDVVGGWWRDGQDVASQVVLHPRDGSTCSGGAVDVEVGSGVYGVTVAAVVSDSGEGDGVTSEVCGVGRNTTQGMGSRGKVAGRVVCGGTRMIGKRV